MFLTKIVRYEKTITLLLVQLHLQLWHNKTHRNLLTLMLKGVLENGLTYYIRHNKLPEERADFYIAQKVDRCKKKTIKRD